MSFFVWESVGLRFDLVDVKFFLVSLNSESSGDCERDSDEHTLVLDAVDELRIVEGVGVGVDEESELIIADLDKYGFE